MIYMNLAYVYFCVSIVNICISDKHGHMTTLSQSRNLKTTITITQIDAFLLNTGYTYFARII